QSKAENEREQTDRDDGRVPVDEDGGEDDEDDEEADEQAQDAPQVVARDDVVEPADEICVDELLDDEHDGDADRAARVALQVSMHGRAQAEVGETEEVVEYAETGEQQRVCADEDFLARRDLRLRFLFVPGRLFERALNIGPLLEVLDLSLDVGPLARLLLRALRLLLLRRHVRCSLSPAAQTSV